MSAPPSLRPTLLELAARHARAVVERLEASLPLLAELGHPALNEIETLIERALHDAGALEKLLKDESKNQ
jgi:hypothetical protein